MSMKENSNGLTTSGQNECLNPAFEDDEPKSSITKSKSEEHIRPETPNGPAHHSSLSDLFSKSSGNVTAPELLRRSSSLADIVMAVSRQASREPSLTDLTISGKDYLKQWKKGNRYVHPFGNNPTILEELMGWQEANEFDADVNQSHAKLVIWIMCTLFLLGMAGAIVLAAEANIKEMPPFAASYIHNTTDSLGLYTQ